MIVMLKGQSGQMKTIGKMKIVQEAEVAVLLIERV